MRLLAPAKINLHLRVGGRRKDGFHEVMTWMCTVGLFDTLEIETARRDGVALTCDREDLPRDRRNLIVAVCQAWAGVLTGNRREEVRPPLSSPVAVGGIDVVLSKRIPIGGGLGGGSSDAARVL